MDDNPYSPPQTDANARRPWFRGWRFRITRFLVPIDDLE
jgi:hypothetical protein